MIESMPIYVVESQAVKLTALGENLLHEVEEIVGGWSEHLYLELFSHQIDSYMHSMAMSDVEKERILKDLKPLVENRSVYLFFNKEGALRGMPINLYATILNGERLVNGPAVVITGDLLQ